MEDKKIFRIEKPRNFSFQKSKHGYKDYTVVGLDVETVNGELYSIQRHCKELGIDDFVLYNGEKEDDLIELLLNGIDVKDPVFFFAHNLEFDLGVLFSNLISFYMDNVDFKKSLVTKNGNSVKIIFPNPTYMRYSLKRSKYKRDIPIYFVDTFKFFMMGLDKVAKLLDLPVRKLERPEYLGERKPNESEFAYFRKYSLIDSEAVYYLGKEIMKFHKLYDVDPKMTVSPASLSKKVFFRRFLKNKVYLPKSKEAVYFALKSYWGGRTEAFCGGTEDIKVYDYNSFYPYAMHKIFIPVEANAWKFTRDFNSEFGFYRIKGEMPFMKVSPLPVKNQRLMFPVGNFDVTVTGFEAKHILKYAKNTKIMQGYYYNGQEDYSFNEYVDHFYREKENIDRKKDPTGYIRTKLLLNSLYGKTIELNESYQYYHALTSSGTPNPYGKRIQTGGFFNPPVASWITGFCRAKLFEEMKKHEESIMYCDTDSLGVQADDYDVKTGTRLGKLKLEGSGRGTIVREKVYIISGEVNKIAKHGFWGNDDQFKAYINDSMERYRVKRMVKLMEAKKQGKKPFVMENQFRSLKLITSSKRANPHYMDFLNDFKWLDPIKLK